MTIRSLWRTAAAGLAAIALSAAAQTEITFYYPVAVGGPITKTIDQMSADFEKENPGIKVKPVYAGTYQDPWYGDIVIAMENGKLAIRFTKTPSLVGDLEHFQHDTFIARWRDRELRADAYVTFALNPDGTIDQAKMKAVSPATDFSFDFQDLLLKAKVGTSK